jgi:Zn-dependent peptidase ImmA (M78 family)
MCDVFGKWFVQTARYFYDFVNFPEVNLSSASPTHSTGRYTDEEIEIAAEQCRRQWGLGLGPLSNIVGLLESKGIIVCRYGLTEEKIEAFSFWNGPRPFIFLSSDKASAARARFDAAHELGHLILHRWIGPDDLEDPKTLRLIEREANRFAGAFLLPRQSFPNEVYTTRLDAFVALKSRWKVAIQAMVYRCKDLGIFDEDQVTNLYKQISHRKWRTKEPLDDQIPLEQPKLLTRAADLVVSAGKKMADQIVNEIQVNADFLAAICGVSTQFFEPPISIEFNPSLK